jgi:hypothetical protein
VVTDIRVMKTRNTLTLEVRFPVAVKSGRVSCAAFLHSTVVSKSDTIVTSGFTVPYVAGASAVNVTITGLKSVVDYDAYCSLTTVDGVANSDAQAVATKTTVQTACCKLLTFSNAPSFVYGSLSKYTSNSPTSQYVYSFTLSSAPGDSVVVTPTLFDGDGNAVSAGVLKSVPTSLTYASAATSLAGTFVLSASSAGLSGTYTVKLLPSGNSAAAYGGTVTATSVQVLNTASPAPKPVLTSAKFADSGSSMDVSFDSLTNKGSVTARSWTCSTLLTFVASEYTSCSWVSASTIRITFVAATEGTTLLSVGGTVSNVPELITAQCPADTDCSLYGKADAVSVQVSAPDSPVVPTVVLQVPAVVSNCDDLKVNPTLTSGNGGRAWTSVVWTVSAASGASTTAIQALLSGTTSMVTVPKALLPSDRYTLSLTVTNFFGQSSSASATFTVDGNPNLPIISILGPATVKTVPGDVLTLYTSTARSTCYVPASQISYAWTVRKGGSDGTVVNKPSISTSPTKFILAPYSLEIESVYTIEFTASASATQNPPYEAISTVSRVTVQVGRGNIVAVVLGGSFRYLASVQQKGDDNQAVSTSTLSLDASQSYDQSYPRGSVVVPLTYAWSCVLVSPTSYGVSCAEKLPARTNSSVLNIPTSGLTFSELFQFTVTVQALDGRFSSYGVTVQNDLGSTKTSINNVVLTKVNPSKKLILTGYVQGGYALDARWAALIDGAAQTFTAGTPVASTFTETQVASALAFPLSVPANTFSAGTTVVFRLTANFAGDSSKYPSYSDVTITMNAPPGGGTLVSDRTSGFALADDFQLVASSWSDDPSDFPLSYEFIYVLVKGQPALTIQSLTSTNQVSTKLPAGLDSQSNNIYVSVNVYDTFLAFGSASVTVQVTKSADQDVSAYISGAVATAAAAGNIDQISQAISNAASSVNTVNCSLSRPSYCASLNRQNCLKTPQTCSACLDGYTGLSGDRNSLCRDASDTTVLGAEGDACTLDSDCELGLCVGNVCAVPVKTCPSENTAECSGRGTCSYSQPNGAAYGRTCTIKDTDCTARCICDDEYGGSACSLSEAELASRDATRSQLCAAVITVSEGDDASTFLMDSLVNALYTSFDPNEVVSATAEATCYDALAILSTMAADGFLSDDSTTTMVLLTSKFALHSSSAAAESGLRRRRRLAEGDSGNGTAHSQAVNGAISGIVDGVLNLMAAGEDAVSIAGDQVQMVVYKSLAADLASLTPPQASIGASTTNRSSAPVPTVEFTSDTLGALATSDGYVQASILNWAVNPFPNSSAVENTVLRLQVNADVLNEDDGSESRRRNQEALQNGSTPALYITLQFTTAHDFNFNVTLDEAFTNPPANFTYPACHYYRDGAYKACTGCWVAAYTNYNVTYGCPLSFLKDLRSSRRRLQDFANDQVGSGDSVNFGVLLSSVAHSISSVLTDNPFAINWPKVKPVVAFLSGIAFCICVGYWYFYRWDLEDKAYLVYAQPEIERHRFNEKHNALLEMYQEGGNAFRNFWQTERMSANFKHTSGSGGKFLATFLPSPMARSPLSPNTAHSSLRLSRSTDSQSRTPRRGLNFSPLGKRSPHSSGVPVAASKDSNEDTLLHALGRTVSSKHNSHAQYDALFDTTAPNSSERALYVSNVVGNFLDSVMPEDSLQKNNIVSWAMFVYTVLRYHEFTAMFFGASLKLTRILRWTNIVLGFLLNVFFDTLFYGIFYPDSGTCESLVGEKACLAEQSQISTDRMCSFTPDPEALGGGNCTLVPPPQTFVFLIIVVLCTMVITVPVQFLYDFILFEFCMRRPRFEDWGLTSEYWIGRSTHTLSAKREDQDTPLQQLYHKVEKERKQVIVRLDGADSQEAQEQHILADDNFRARQIYDSHMTAEYEATELLKEVKAFLDVHAHAPKVPWQNSKYSVVMQAKANAIQDHIGVYSDGRPVPMTIFDRLLYGTPMVKLVASIEKARERSKHIQSQLKEFGDGELQNRDMMLIQYFILEQFSALKQYVLHRHMFVFNLTTPKTIHVGLWLASWFVVLGTIIFLLYWIFMWGVHQGGFTIDNWFINIATSFAQDVCVVQVFRVYIIYSLSMASIKPQLQYIYRVLNKVAVSYAQDELVDDYLDVRVCQHLSPACRAAQSHIAQNLATANILRHIDDADVAVCRLGYDINLATIATAVFTLPLLMSIINEAAGDVVLESLLPATFNAALITNYYFYTAAGMFILMPYLVTIGVYLWKHKIHKQSRKMLLARRKGESSADFARRWHAAQRAQGRSFTAMAYEQLLLRAYYLTRPRELLQRVRGILSGRYDPVARLQWKNLNLPADLHGHPCTQPLPPQDYSYAGRIAEAHSTAALRREARATIPTEVAALLIAAKVSWVEQWTHEASLEAEGPVKLGYMDMLLHRALNSGRPLPTVHGGMATEQRPSEPLQHHSIAVLEYHNQYGILRTVEQALDHVQRNLVRYVSEGRIHLPDHHELDALWNSTVETCNVYVDFTDLRYLLEDALYVYQPCGQPLTSEERDELVHSCCQWMVLKNGKHSLRLRYHKSNHETTHAELVKLGLGESTSQPQSDTQLGPRHHQDGKNNNLNFSAPFQMLRRWFVQAAVAIQRYDAGLQR